MLQRTVLLLLLVTTAPALAEYEGYGTYGRDPPGGSSDRDYSETLQAMQRQQWGTTYRGKCCGPGLQDQTFPSDADRDTWRRTVGPMSNGGVDDQELSYCDECTGTYYAGPDTWDRFSSFLDSIHDFFAGDE